MVANRPQHDLFFFPLKTVPLLCPARCSLGGRGKWYPFPSLDTRNSNSGESCRVQTQRAHAFLDRATANQYAAVTATHQSPRSMTT